MKPNEKKYSNRKKKHTEHKCLTERGMQEAQRMREETRIFVGRGFSDDVNQANAERLQSLTCRFCSCNTDLAPGTFRGFSFQSPARSLCLTTHYFTAAL